MDVEGEGVDGNGSASEEIDAGAIGVTGGGDEKSRASFAIEPGAAPIPSGRSIATVWRLPALSATEARTRIASAVPASHSAEFSADCRRRGTARHSRPGAWYSTISDFRSRFSSLTSHRTAALLPRRLIGARSIVGGVVSTITFKFGSIVRSSGGKRRSLVSIVRTANQYSPSLGALNLNHG